MTFYKNTKMALCACLLITTLGFASPSSAETEWVDGVRIVRTLTDIHFGGCMVYLDKTIGIENPALSSCPNKWVSLDCDAIHHTQAQANAMWSSALVALSLQKEIAIQIDDSKKINGYCMARRLDVFR